MKKDTVAKFVPGKTRIKYGGAVIDGKEINAIKKVLDRNWWTLDEEGVLFEKELAKKAGVKNSLFTNSGSSALFLALSSLGLTPGSEIIIPAVNFPTLVSACLLNGLKPVYVDVDPKTFCIDLKKAENAVTKNTKVIVVVNIAGNTIDPKALSLFKRKKIITMLDNCDGFGTTINGKFIESFYDIAATSFHAAHIITTGEGGALFTSNDTFYKTAKSLREWGRADDSDAVEVAKKAGLPKDYPGRYTYVTRGFNLKPLELQAAMGRVQLKKITEIKKARNRNYDTLAKEIIKRKIPVTIAVSPKKASVSWFAFPMTTVEHGIRGSLRDFLESKNIETRVIFAGNITKQPAYAKSNYKISGSLSNSDKILHDSFFVSTHPSISKEMILYIAESLQEYFDKTPNNSR